MEIFSDIWNVIFIRPMVNSLILLYILLGQNFGLSIISFTVIIRVLMFPLSIRQTKQMKAMSVIQPKIKQIQEKYKDDKIDIALYYYLCSIKSGTMELNEHEDFAWIEKKDFDALLPGHLQISLSDGKSHVQKAGDAFRKLGVPQNLL